MLPPASATLVWALSTPHEDIRCLAWKHGRGWMVAIYFGREALDVELAPSRKAMRLWHTTVRRKLIALGFGAGGPLGGKRSSLAAPQPSDPTETDDDDR